MGKPWFRMYHEMIDDPKISTLTDPQFRLWTEILCLACRAGNSGNIGLNPTQTSFVLRRKSSRPITELIKRHLISLADDGTIKVSKWKDRQFESDSSTQRVQEHRAKLDKVIKGAF